MRAGGLTPLRVEPDCHSVTSQQFACSFPAAEMVGLSRFELLTPRLSSVCSNQLSYRPLILKLSSPPHCYGFSTRRPCLLEPPSELVKEPEFDRFPQN